MNPAQETIAALLAVLEAERAAIRTFDTNGVVKAAADKEALAIRMSSLSPELLTPVAAEIVALRAGLRRNGILLAHARACVARAMDIISPRESGGRRGRLRATV